MFNGYNENEILKRLVKAYHDAGKTYKFSRQDRNKPVEFWFQNSKEGLVLFIVLYSQACRWLRCLGCNLPSKASLKHVSYKALMRQIDFLFADKKVQKHRRNIKKVILSNNGSVLDEKTFSSTALMYLIAMANLHLPSMSMMSIETRVEYVDISELEFISRALKEGDTPTQLELAIGFEAFDKNIRNKIFRKGLSLKAFEDFVEKIAAYHYSLKCYFMQKPVPFMSDSDAILDVQNGIDYLAGIASKHGIKINMHLNPTFVAKGTPLEQSFKKGEFTPPRLSDVAKAALHAEGKNISIFVGLCDEGLAAEGGSFIRKGNAGDKKAAMLIEQFNKTGDFRLLRMAADIGAETS